MCQRTMFRPRRAARLAGALALTAVLAACGGGDDDAAAGGNDTGGASGGGAGGATATLTCNTAYFGPDSVEVPSSAQMAAYAGTYAGEEGVYGPNPGDPFIKSADATFVLSSSGTITYKGTAYTVTSVCVDKVAGVMGKLMYVHAANGHFDIAETAQAGLGSAWGVSPADGTTIYTSGDRQ